MELMFVLAVLALVAGMAVPQIAAGVESARTRAAARYLAAHLGMARTHAVTRGAVVAVQFQPGPSGTAIALVVDGNGNGVRTQDIGAGIDRAVHRLDGLEAAFPGVRFGLASDPGSNGIHLGGSMLLSFTPDGTSTSGSLYLFGRDGSQFAVRVLGATGRVRLERLDAHTNTWSSVL